MTNLHQFFSNNPPGISVWIMKSWSFYKSGDIWYSILIFLRFYSVISRFPLFSVQIVEDCVSVHNGIHPNHTQCQEALNFTIKHLSHAPHKKNHTEENSDVMQHNNTEVVFVLWLQQVIHQKTHYSRLCSGRMDLRKRIVLLRNW